MKLKKHLQKLLSFLLLSVFSLTLFVGCAQEDIELAADVLTAVLETQLEEDDEYTEIVSEVNNSDTETKDYREVIAEENTVTEDSLISEDGIYTSKEDVAAYLHEYGHLPSNFITKKEAKKLGWVSSEGNLDEVAPGMSIGGDYFGNYEGNLPEAKDRDYYECDIDFDGTYRNGKRIVFSNDGLIYYTEDHYETFELLYGEE